MPRLRLQVEAKDVREGHARVVETTVTTIDVDLVVVQGIPHVGSGRRSSNSGCNVLGDIYIALNTLPEDLWVLLVGYLHYPAVIEALGRACMATEDKYLPLRCEDGAVLRTRLREFDALRLFLFPIAILYLQILISLFSASFSSEITKQI